MNIQQRLDIFFQRLEAAPAAANTEEAMGLVCRLIEEVEDDLCFLPREDPPPTTFSGRMYAPQADHIKPDAAGGLQASTRRHLIRCAANGRITIIHKRRLTVIFTKPGKPK